MSIGAPAKPVERESTASQKITAEALFRRLRTVLSAGGQIHGYVPALAVFCIAFSMHLLVIHFLSPKSPVILFLYVTAMLVGAWCGYGPGLLVVTFTVCLVPFATSPNYSLSQVHPAGYSILLLVSLIVSRTATSRRRAEAILRTTNRSLDARVLHQTEALQARLAEIETLYAKLPVGLAFLDTELRFVRINEMLASINGLAVKDHARRSLRSVFPSSIAHEVEPLCRHVLETGEPLRGLELRSSALTADGVERTWMVDCTRVELEDGQVLGVQIVVQDITERKRSEAAVAQTNSELRRVNADLEQFAYSASHDLQEPLRMVTIFAQLLGRRYSGRLDAQADGYIENVVTGAQRLEVLIKGLRTYLKVTAVEPASGNVGTKPIMERCLANLRAAIEASGACIEYDDLPHVGMQEVHVEQLFQNLISNAIKYRSDRAPHIRIRATAEETGWRFAVSDNGIGIDPRYAQQIFGVFKRLHGSDDYEGAGIGLAICQKIVEGYRGRIWVESESGQGATFYFTAPFAK